MNNAGTVVSVRKGCTGAPDVITALDWAVGTAESNGEYMVMNLSSNDYLYGYGTLTAQYMRKAAARGLLVQSAGNYGDDACSRSYSATMDVDGILVVGAVDASGAVVANFDESGVPSGTNIPPNPGSSYGSCVEVWAPGQLIWIDWSDTSHTRRYKWSGTSFAAPAVSALAARYGNSSTNPVVREAYIRAQLFSTGSSDPLTSAAIKVPSYTQSPLFTLPTKLTPTSVSASSTYSTFTASKATDGNYLTTAWNSGLTPSYPSQQPYIDLDFGSTKTLYSIRFMPAQSPSGTSTHDVYIGNSYPPTGFAATITQNIMDGEMLSVDLSGYSARYVRLVTHASPSWASYYEVEVFGN